MQRLVNRRIGKLVDYPYMSNTKKLKQFIEEIVTRKIPDKINIPYLVKAGYKSNGDRPIVKVLKFIGFLTEQGVPTDLYKNYLDTSKNKSVIAYAIMEAYSDLFDIYDDAYSRDNEALVNFFRTESGLGETAVQFMVGTFKALCELADFKKIDESKIIVPKQALPKEALPTQRTITAERGLTVNLNIELSLPPTENTAIYDAFFKSMKKYLLESEKKDD